MLINKHLETCVFNFEGDKMKSKRNKIKFNTNKTRYAALTALAAAGMIFFTDTSLVLAAETEQNAETNKPAIELQEVSSVDEDGTPTQQAKMTSVDVSDQEIVTEEAADDLENAENTVAKTESIQSEASEENIQATKETILEAKQANIQTAEDIANKEQEIDAKEIEVNIAEEEKTAADQAVSNQKEVVADKGQDLTESEATLEDTINSSLQEQITVKESDLTDAEQSLIDQEAALEDIDTKKSELEAEKASKEVEITEAQAVIEDTEAQKEIALGSIDQDTQDIERQLEAIEKNYIEIPAGYEDALVDYYNDFINNPEGIDYEAYNARMDAISAPMLQGLNDFYFSEDQNAVTNASLVNEFVAIVNENYAEFEAGEITESTYNNAVEAAYVDMLTKGNAVGYRNQFQATEADAKIILDEYQDLIAYEDELSAFTAGMLNPIRDVFENASYVVTEGGLAFARDVAEQYDAAGYSITDRSVDEFHYVEGITEAAGNYGLDQSGQYYENISAGFVNEDFVGRDGLPVLTLNDVKEGIYYSIVSMLFDDSHVDQGHAFSLTGLNGDMPTSFLGVSVDNMNQVHIITVENTATIADQSTFEQNYSLFQDQNTDNLANYSANVVNADDAIQNQQAIIEANSSDIEGINNELADITAEKSTLTTSIENLNVEIQTLRETLAQLKEQIENGDNAAEGNLLNDLRNDVAEAQSALNTALADLEALQTVATEKSNVLDQLLAELNVLLNELDELQTIQSVEVDDLENLKQLLDNFLNADEKLVEAEQYLEYAKEIYGDELASLALLEDRQASYKEVVETDLNSQGYTKIDQSLPETGTGSSVSTLVGGVTTILIGLGLVKPKHKQEDK